MLKNYNRDKRRIQNYFRLARTMSNVKADLVGGSETTVTEHEGHHFWTIDNWKDWVTCSYHEHHQEMTLFSQEFEVTGDTEDTTTRWKIKAFPVEVSLAFQLINQNEYTPLGYFDFERYVDDGLNIRCVENIL